MYSIHCSACGIWAHNTCQHTQNIAMIDSLKFYCCWKKNHVQHFGMKNVKCIFLYLKITCILKDWHLQYSFSCGSSNSDCLGGILHCLIITDVLKLSWWKNSVSLGLRVVSGGSKTPLFRWVQNLAGTVSQSPKWCCVRIEPKKIFIQLHWNCSTVQTIICTHFLGIMFSWAWHKILYYLEFT
jgi:hypothetical protein